MVEPNGSPIELVETFAKEYDLHLNPMVAQEVRELSLEQYECAAKVSAKEYLHLIPLVGHEVRQLLEFSWAL